MPIREQQTTNKQHAIPQSIMSVEFKIIGDLTLKQFFFLLIFCGLAYASFILISALIIKWLLVLFFVTTGLAFAFMPLGDRGLDTWIVNFLRAMFLPNQFVYRKDEDIPSVFLYQNLDVLKSELITLTPTSSRRKIEAYLEQQEAPVDKLDIDEKGFILKVKEAYSHPDYWTGPGAGIATSEDNTLPTAGVTTTVIEDYLPTGRGTTPTTEKDLNKDNGRQTQQTGILPSTETEQSDHIPASRPSAGQDLSRLELPAGPVKPTLATPQAPSPDSVSVISPPQTAALEIRPQTLEKLEPPVALQAPQTQIVPETVQQTVQPAQITKSRMGMATEGYKHPKQSHTQDGYYSPTITPDMRAGRMFINLSQDTARGEIILPIRGERVLKDAREQEFEASEEQKIKDLDTLIKDVRSKELMQKQIINAQKIKEQDEARKHALAEASKRADAQKEQERLQQAEVYKKQAEEKAKQEKEAQEKERAFQEQERLANLRQQEEALRKQKEELIKKQQEERRTREMQSTSPILEDSSPKPQPIPIQPAQINETPTTPNIIWGLIATNYQNSTVGVPGVVVVIRNQKGEVVRAVKTSAQGKFGITTPLINGSYTIEVDKEKKSGLNFAITAVNAKGEIIPTMEITGTP